jgi:hypothetical protein
MSFADLDDAEAAAGDAASPRAGREARRKYWVDLGLFLAWMIAAIPGLTGVPLHEWLATGIVVVLLTHLVMHWNWVVRHLTRLRVRAKNQIDRLLDLAMWTLATTVMLSGFLISEAVLPAIGLDVQQTTLWIRVHSLSSMLLLVVLACHLLQHLDWIWTQTKSVLRGAR